MVKVSRIRRLLAGNVRRLSEADGLSQGALAADAGILPGAYQPDRKWRGEPGIGYAGQDRRRAWRASAELLEE